MNKDALQITIGVGTVVLMGIGTLLYVNRNKNKTVPINLLDKLSSYNRNQVMMLHPNARKKFAEFIYAVEKKGYKVLITSGYRDFDKQARLYKENNKNARAGYSNHNYGYAIDINIIDPITGKTLLRKATSKSRWNDSEIVSIAKKMGFGWGGDFNNYYDPIHFYMPREASTADMKKLADSRKVDKQGYVLAFSGTNKPDIEVNIPNELAA